MSYADLRSMYMDGLMSKETFAHHAFHMRALPYHEIEIGEQVEDLNGTLAKKAKTE
jgi:hypothetical protein